jgi:hypothetical protein
VTAPWPGSAFAQGLGASTAECPNPAAPGLFAEPERVEIPDKLSAWGIDRLESGVCSSVRCGDWAAAHRVVAELLVRAPYRHGPLAAVARAVLEVHQPERIYKDCGHIHEYQDDGSMPDGVIPIGDDGDLVCEVGFEFTVCRGCCMRNGYLTEECQFGHEHPPGWPCSTFQPCAEGFVRALGVRL